MIEVLFWFLFLAIVHSYVIFPLSIRIFYNSRKADFKEYELTDHDLPFVSIIMSVYNEEEVIIEKIESILKSTYPGNKIEIIIGSDNSNDNTNLLVEKIAGNEPQITFFPFAKRQGKPNVINQLVGKAKGDLLLLTDANVIFNESTIFELTKFFKDQKVGLVDANMINKALNKAGISIQEKAYISREVRIKNREGIIWGAMMGPFGGCFVLRKKLYAKVPSNFLVDDFYINMKVIEQNYKSINNINAKVYEDVSNVLAEEFRRKIRIATGNFQNLRAFSNLIFRGNGIGYCFISHKIIRWFGPFIILFLLFSSIYLGISNGIYMYVFYIQLIIILFPFIDYLLRKLGIHIIILRFITHFYSMNLALFIGFIKFLKGVKNNVWQPTKRNQ